MVSILELSDNKECKPDASKNKANLFLLSMV